MMQWIGSWKHNWGAKVLSFIAAVVVWIFVMRDQNPVIEVAYTVPVQVQNLDQGLLVDGVPKEVKVRLHGPRNAVLDINPEVLKAYVNLRDVTVGQDNVTIDFTAPTGTFIDSMTPNAITVTIDEYMVKELQVQVQPLGVLPNDIAIKEVKIIPQVVTIAGPDHQVSKASYAVVRINLDKHRESFAEVGETIAIDAAGNSVEGITITPKPAQVQYDLERLRMEKKVPLQPNLVGYLPVGYRVKKVEVEPKELTIVGKESILNTIDSLKTTDIPIDGYTQSFTGNYSFVLPDGVNTNVENVTVKVDIEPQM